MIYAIVYLGLGILIAIVFNLYILRLRKKLPGVFPGVDWLDFGVIVTMWPWALVVLWLDRKEYKV